MAESNNLLSLAFEGSDSDEEEEVKASVVSPDTASYDQEAKAATNSLGFEYFEQYDNFEEYDLQVPLASGEESARMEAADPELFQAGVEEHALRLGIDPINDAEYLWIARESLVAPLPDGWYHIAEDETEQPYYYNEVTGESRWEHPSDDQFRQLFQNLRRKKLESNAHDVSSFPSSQNHRRVTWASSSMTQAGHIQEPKEQDNHDAVVQELTEEVETLKAQLGKEKATIDSLRDEKEQMEEDLRSLSEQLTDALKKENDGREANKKMKKALIRARNELEARTDADENKAESKEGFASSSIELDAMKVQRDKLINDLRASQQQIQTLRADLKHSTADQTSNESQVKELQDELASKDKKLMEEKEANGNLQQKLDSYQQELREAKQSLDDYKNETQSAQTAGLEQEKQRVLEMKKALDQIKAEKNEVEEAATKQKEAMTVQLTDMKTRGQALAQELRNREKEKKAITERVEQLEHEVLQSKEELKKMNETISKQEQLIVRAKEEGRALAQQEAAKEIAKAKAETARLSELYSKEVDSRRKLHNRLMELQGNIRVFCRVRPIQPPEKASNQDSTAVFFPGEDMQSLELLVNGDTDKGTGQKHTFEFDHVFQPESSQSDVFEQTRQLVVSALDGYNVCIFAYGQTGSGKTHTMEGTATDRGVNYRALQELFAIRDERATSGNFECSMKLSILEVYNETIVDLLQDMSAYGSPTKTGAKVGLELRLGKAGVYAENLSEMDVHCQDDVVHLMKLGHSHRSVGAHDVNEHSSRSHLVVSIKIETKSSNDGRIRSSKLHLIDLAGSERVGKTAATGQRLKEAQNINRSLSALGDVIAALASGSKHVPYRNSKLTFLLQDSLSGGSKALMFVNISPVQWNAWETLCSLNFASRCRNVALGSAKQNVAVSGNSPQSMSGSPAVSPLPTRNGAPHGSMSVPKQAVLGAKQTSNLTSKASIR